MIHNQPPTDPLNTSTRQPRVYFPPVAYQHSGSASSELDAVPKPFPIGLGPPPNARATSVAQDGLASADKDGRSRVRSAHAAPTGPTALGRSHRSSTQASTLLRRRTLTTEGTGQVPRPDKGRRMASSLEPAMDDLEPGIFSDEYDLSHEDPKILEDVQRALKLKIRREARLQATQQAIRVSGSSYSSSSSPGPKPPALVTRIAKPSMESELDFSPSVGPDNLHPVPTSTNDGSTLDWGAASEEDKAERKWHLMAKRKAKDKSSMPIGKEAVERQQLAFDDKLASIRASVKPQTLKKAAITSDQLRRRYQSYASLESPSGVVNLVKVVHWYAKLDPLVQSSLDQAEPMTWQKHLRSRRGMSGPQRLPWHVTALIVEEHLKGQTRRLTMDTIPEDVLVGSPSMRDTSPPRTPPSVAPFEYLTHNHLEASLSRNREYDNHVSFEPALDPNRRSIDEGSRLSADGGSRPWKQSLPRPTDSPRSSIYSSLFSGSTRSQNLHGPSPSSSGIHLRDFASRVRRQGNESDEASSSHQSVSEDNRSEDGAKSSRRSPRKSKLHFRPPQLDLVARSQPDADAKDQPDEDNVEDWHDASKTPEQPPKSSTLGREDVMTAKNTRSPFPRQDTSATAVGVPSARIIQLRGLRSSLPSSDKPTFMQDDERRARLLDEAAEQQEYERRAQLLEDTLSQNYRNRHLLQRIAAGIKEYEAVQSRLSKALGLPHTALSPDLIDAFSHDPAVVTGHTRYLKGYRAVDNIHQHIKEQAEVVQAFLQQASPVNFASDRSVLDGPVKSLCAALDSLETRRTSVTKRATEVSETLTRVKKLHAAVKAEYNAAMNHTSSVYPELSHIVALEESYKDRYQQLWEFGMDALTFLLDTVTPFWRNYGKVIGVDAQDFLIIPWYRNEFTGEADRYPIKVLPKRSFRHWVALVIFFSGTLGVTALQSRAASTFCSYYKLPLQASPSLWWITLPLFGTIAIIQWTAVLVEASIVCAQVAVVMWWIGWWARVFD